MAFPAHIWDQLKNLTADDLCSALTRDGWSLDTHGGSQRIYRKSPTQRVSIHYHPKKTYGAKMLQGLLSDIGWTEDDLRRFESHQITDNSQCPSRYLGVSMVDGRWSNVYPHQGCEGRQSTTMKTKAPKGGLVQGTLDMLILRTLQRGPAHGHDISKHIRHTSNEVLQVEHGSLYPALHRLERKRLVSGKWELHPERKREFKYYRLTAAGRRYLAVQESRWSALVDAIAHVMGSSSTPRAAEN